MRRETKKGKIGPFQETIIEYSISGRCCDYVIPQITISLLFHIIIDLLTGDDLETFGGSETIPILS